MTDRPITGRLRNLVDGATRLNAQYGFIISGITGFISDKFFGVTIWIALILSAVFLVLAGPLIILPLYRDTAWFNVAFKPLSSDLLGFVASGMFRMSLDFYYIVQGPIGLWVVFVFGVFGLQTLKLGRLSPELVTKSSLTSR